jgi:antitoxin VapB
MVAGGRKNVYIYVYTFKEASMITKVFRSGNSLAVRLPAKMHIAKAGEEVSIEKRGNRVMITPHRRSLKGLMDRFAAFDPDFMEQGRERGQEPERRW